MKFFNTISCLWFSRCPQSTHAYAKTGCNFICLTPLGEEILRSARGNTFFIYTNIHTYVTLHIDTNEILNRTFLDNVQFMFVSPY